VVDDFVLLVGQIESVVSRKRKEKGIVIPKFRRTI
jgi:hypothetical protein